MGSLLKLSMKAALLALCAISSLDKKSKGPKSLRAIKRAIKIIPMNKIKYKIIAKIVLRRFLPIPSRKIGK